MTTSSAPFKVGSIVEFTSRHSYIKEGSLGVVDHYVDEDCKYIAVVSVFRIPFSDDFSKCSYVRTCILKPWVGTLTEADEDRIRRFADRGCGFDADDVIRMADFRRDMWRQWRLLTLIKNAALRGKRS